MSKLGPISRTKLIQRFKKLGFDGPFSGGSHMFMSHGDLDVHIPNPHQGDISADLHARVLRQAGISRNQWIRI